MGSTRTGTTDSLYCCKQYQQQHICEPPTRQDHPPQVNMSLYVYATCLIFLVLCITVRQPISLGLTQVWLQLCVGILMLYG